MTSKDALPIIKVSFRLRGASFDPAEVTSRVGLAPTLTYRAGDPISRGLGKRREDGWVMQIGPRATLEIATMLGELRDLIAVAPALLREACADLGLTPVIYCPIELTSRLAPSVMIPQDIVAWAAELDAAVDIDVLLWSLDISEPG
jgi:hypothetical protein